MTVNLVRDLVVFAKSSISDFAQNPQALEALERKYRSNTVRHTRSVKLIVAVLKDIEIRIKQKPSKALEVKRAKTVRLLKKKREQLSCLEYSWRLFLENELALVSELIRLGYLQVNYLSLLDAMLLHDLLVYESLVLSLLEDNKLNARNFFEPSNDLLAEPLKAQPINRVIDAVESSTIHFLPLPTSSDDTESGFLSTLETKIPLRYAAKYLGVRQKQLKLPRGVFEVTLIQLYWLGIKFSSLGNAKAEKVVDLLETKIGCEYLV